MKTNAFDLLSETEVPEVSGLIRHYRHKDTGAELISVINKDENKCFGVSFKTPPSDSTGVAHILEHSVLCGSEKYPVKEPFVELLKGSLQTFLNAFTFPDKTCYPVASANLQDFYNLVDVYLDAVFHPRISEDIFRQEGWSFDAANPDGPWAYKGVVYNEMKGAYSTPDSILAEKSQQAVFPDTTYGLDSGGDPEVILNLTYEAFKKFHETCYHPSNARFFFWGDDPEEKRLQIIEEELARFTRGEAREQIPLQRPFDSPRSLEFAYAAGENENRAHFTVNWLLCETVETENALILEVLEHIFTGLPGSPLRRALIESGLGEDLSGAGLEMDLRQIYYSVGLKGLDPADVSKAEMIIYETLGELAEEGIPAEDIEAAVNSLEFDLRENNSGRFPRGLAAMVTMLSTWLYNGDPLAAIRWEKPLASLKARLASGEKIFEEAIKKWFLNNEHRATVVLLPDEKLGAGREAAEQQRIEAARQAMSQRQRESTVAESARRRQAQEEPDSPEALALIPGLELADLPRQNAILPLEEQKGRDIPFIFHDLDTSGIIYATLLLPLSAVPENLVPLIPLYGRALTEMGTKKRDYIKLGLDIAAKTGGIGAGPLVLTRRECRSPQAFLSISGKAVADKAEDLFDLLQECVTEPDPDQPERFGHMVAEARARAEYGLVAAGHAAVGLRLSAHSDLSGWLGEQMSGISNLLALRELDERVNKDWPSVLADLLQLKELIVNSRGAVFDCTSHSRDFAKTRDLALRLEAALPGKKLAPASWSLPALPKAEGFVAPSQINYIGKGSNLYALGYKYHGSAQVIMRHLRMSYLWEKVRVQGGAYGAFCSFDRMSGNMVMASYRDPSVSRTLKAFDGAAAYLAAFNPDQKELTKAIVGAIGDLDAYMLPDAKGTAALTRHLSGDTTENRQKMREEILCTTARDFREFSEILKEASAKAAICCVGGSAVEREGREKGWELRNLL